MSNHPSSFKTIRAQTAGNGKGKSKSPCILGCLGATAIFLGLLIVTGIAYFGSLQSTKSIILIREPVDNEPLYIGEAVTLRALARDDQKVEQVELWVDDILVSYENSDIAGGISPFPILTSWVPSQAGTYTISARSTNTKGKQSVSQMNITVLDAQDSDGDQVPDHMDNCPDQAGSEASQGCIDRDFDGIPDDADTCPDISGLPEDGCPAPSQNDRDGDGFLDEADACPDEPGSPGARGCLDSDGDGVADYEDECPEEAGLTGACPSTGDADNDGVSDEEDACPTAWGTPELTGCSDEDGDGIPDHEDTCPSTAGSTDNAGCPDMAGVLPPPPTPEDDDDPPEEGGIFDDLLPNPDPQPKAVVPIEIEAFSMYIRNDYETVNCYLNIGDIYESPPRQFVFETNGTQRWDIAEQLDGDNSINTFADDELPLEIDLQCIGFNEDSSETLADFDLSHPSGEWDGRNLQAATDSNDFSVSYHICSPNCEESDLATPYFYSVSMGPRGEGPYIAHWEWDGNEDEIDGFMISQVRQFDTLPLIYLDQTDARSLNVDEIEPACGETLELIMYAYKYEDGRIRVSRRSNSQIWTSREACHHTAMITFQNLDVHHPPTDEDGLHIVGPLEGHFYITNGDDTTAFWFDGTWRSNNGYRHDGLKLTSGTYPVQNLLDWINRERNSCLGNGCHSNSYYAPYNDFVVINYDEREDLIIGGEIIDDDTGRNDDDTFFSVQTTIEVENIESGRPQWITLEDRFANLTVIVQILPNE